MKKYINTILFFVLVTFSVYTLTGCKGVTNEKEPEVQVGEADKKEEETSQENQFRVVETIKGTIEVPAEPKRIIIKAYVGDLVALGVKPIAGDMDKNLFDAELSNEYTRLEAFEAEAIMELEPDLIILPANSEEYDKLSQIAPTVMLNDLEISTEERIEYLGKLLGREEQAKKVLENFNNLAMESKEKLDAAGIVNNSITIIEDPYIFGEKYGRGADVVYNYLGFDAPQKVQEKFDNNELYFEVSEEVLSDYCGDYILRSIYEGAPDISDDTVWNSIPAVKEGRLIEIDFYQFFAKDIYTMSKQISYITEAILATVQ